MVYSLREFGIIWKLVQGLKFWIPPTHTLTALSWPLCCEGLLQTRCCIRASKNALTSWNEKISDKVEMENTRMFSTLLHRVLRHYTMVTNHMKKFHVAISKFNILPSLPMTVAKVIIWHLLASKRRVYCTALVVNIMWGFVWLIVCSPCLSGNNWGLEYIF